MISITATPITPSEWRDQLIAEFPGDKKRGLNNFLNRQKCWSKSFKIYGRIFTRKKHVFWTIVEWKIAWIWQFPLFRL